jgi:hypothetical protein
VLLGICMRVLVRLLSSAVWMASGLKPHRLMLVVGGRLLVGRCSLILGSRTRVVGRREGVGDVDRSGGSHALRGRFHCTPSPSPNLVHLGTSTCSLGEVAFIVGNVHAPESRLVAPTIARHSHVGNRCATAVKPRTSKPPVVWSKHRLRNARTRQQNALVRKFRRFRERHAQRIVDQNARSEHAISLST